MGLKIVENRTYRAITEEYIPLYVDKEVFDIAVECRGYDVEDYAEDSVEVRSSYTLSFILDKVEDTKQKQKIEDMKFLLDREEVSYIYFMLKEN